MTFKYETIPPAGPEDIDALVELSLSNGDPRHHLQDFEKVLAARTLEAIAMPVLDLVKEMDLAVAIEAGGWTLSRVASPDPRWAMAAVRRPEGEGFLIAVKSTIRTADSPTAKAMIDAKLETLGPRGDAVSKKDYAIRIIAEMDAESAVVREIALSGWPADIPPLSTATSWREVAIHAFGRPVPPKSGDMLVDIAARRSCGTEMDAIVKAIPERGYMTTCLAKAGSSHNYDGEPWISNAELCKPYDWRAAIAALGAVLPQATKDAIAAKAAEIGARTYVGYADTEQNLAILRAGAAAAQLDGGLPGDGASAVMRKLEHGALLASAPRLAGEIERLRTAYAAAPKDEDGRVTYNDLNNSVRVEEVADGAVIRLTDQNGHFAIVIQTRGGATLYALTRTGRPMDSYLDYAKGRATEVDSLRSLDVGRDYANVKDPLAPIARDEAVARIMTGDEDFPGFTMSFSVQGGQATWKKPPSLALRTVRDLNTIKSCIHSGWVEIEEDASAEA